MVDGSNFFGPEVRKNMVERHVGEKASYFMVARKQGEQKEGIQDRETGRKPGRDNRIKTRK